MNLIDDPHRKKSVRKVSCILKFEWEVLSYCMVPFLSTVDMVRLQRVSKGFKECVDLGAKTALHYSKKSLDTIWNFIDPRFQTVLLKKSMLDRFGMMAKRGLRENYKSENSTFCNDEASLCVLLFFLRERKPRVLKHLLHCVVPRWNLRNRAMFRQMYLRIEMYFASPRFKKSSIKRKACLKQNSMSSDAKTDISVSVSRIINNDLPNVSTLTEANLQQHQRLSLKRKREVPKRSIKKPKLYAEEYQKDVKVEDDFKEYSDDSPVNVQLEERSEDSQSQGSLVDFIVNDESDATSVSDRTETDEEVLEDATETDSSCNTSDLSGIFSDDED